MRDRNVLGGPLEPCGTDRLTGLYRNGCCSTGPEDSGWRTICAVVAAEFLEHAPSAMICRHRYPSTDSPALYPATAGALPP